MSSRSEIIDFRKEILAELLPDTYRTTAEIRKRICDTRAKNRQLDWLTARCHDKGWLRLRDFLGAPSLSEIDKHLEAMQKEGFITFNREPNTFGWKFFRPAPSHYN